MSNVQQARICAIFSDGTKLESTAYYLLRNGCTYLLQKCLQPVGFTYTSAYGYTFYCVSSHASDFQHMILWSHGISPHICAACTLPIAAAAIHVCELCTGSVCLSHTAVTARSWPAFCLCTNTTHTCHLGDDHTTHSHYTAAVMYVWTIRHSSSSIYRTSSDIYIGFFIDIHWYCRERAVSI